MTEYIMRYENEFLQMLPDKMQPLVRCKDCELRGNKDRCIVAFVADKQGMPVFIYDNRGEWFCADGKRKDGEHGRSNREESGLSECKEN